MFAKWNKLARLFWFLDLNSVLLIASAISCYILTNSDTNIRYRGWSIVWCCIVVLFIGLIQYVIYRLNKSQFEYQWRNISVLKTGKNYFKHNNITQNYPITIGRRTYGLGYIFLQLILISVINYCTASFWIRWAVYMIVLLILITGMYMLPLSPIAVPIGYSMKFYKCKDQFGNYVFAFDPSEFKIRKGKTKYWLATMVDQHDYFPTLNLKERTDIKSEDKVTDYKYIRAIANDGIFLCLNSDLVSGEVKEKD